MNPFFIESTGAPLFAVYHSPGGAPRGEAVVVCQPLGHETFRCYRTLQVLCAELAAGGYHVLRFDFTNTGNSADTESPAFDIWVNDIARAIRELTDIAGTRTMSLVGVRLAAAACLQLGDAVPALRHLALWDPVFDGASFLRELDTLHEKVCAAHPGGPGGVSALVDDSGNERVGLNLPPGLRAGIGVIRPDRFAAPAAERVTVIASREGPERLPEPLTRHPATELRRVDSTCGWNDAGRFTEGLAPGAVMEALRRVLLA